MTQQGVFAGAIKIAEATALVMALYVPSGFIRLIEATALEIAIAQQNSIALATLCMPTAQHKMAAIVTAVTTGISRSATRAQRVSILSVVTAPVAQRGISDPILIATRSAMSFKIAAATPRMSRRLAREAAVVSAATRGPAAIAAFVPRALTSKLTAERA